MNTIRCPNCGEDYSVTYKRCPFCEEKKRLEAKQKGGKRLGRNSNRNRGRRYVRTISFLISIVLIIGAIYIVASIARTLLGVDKGGGDAQTSPVVSAQASDNADASSPPQVTETNDGAAVTAITLDKTDVSLFSAGETCRVTADVSPANAGGAVTWTSENPAIATVSADGLLTAVSGGTVTVTAQAGSIKADCIVRVKAPAASGSTATPAAGQTLTLNRTDITLSKGESFRLSVSGATGAVAWNIGNPSVATITSGGTVTGVAGGRTNATATVDGKTLTCTVRVG